MEETGVQANVNSYKEIEKIFIASAKNKASDIHIKGGMKIVFRVSTHLYDVGSKIYSAEEVKNLIYDIMTPQQIKIFEETGSVDFAYSVEGTGRFRINVYKDRGSVAIAARRVNTYIPDFKELNLPEEVMKKIASYPSGLVLVVGPTGQGKSTTLASILQYINKTRRVHLITIEDPIEYLFVDEKAIINQREVGIDVPSFHDALKYMLRQNPDVILIGEMRDAESVDAALVASETGHLVFSTLHASGAPQTIGRILDLFPAEKHDQIRQMLAFNLKAVICQKLLPSCKEGVKMVPVLEIMIVNPIIQKLIAEKEDKKIIDVIRGGQEEGMQDFNQALYKWIKTGYITEQVALRVSPNPEHLKMMLKGIVISEERKIIQ